MLKLDWQAFPSFDGRLWVAYSGGLDSHVLLHFLSVELPPAWKERLCAIHVNHQLSPNADAWQAHCEAVCLQLDLPLVVQKVEVASRGSIELAAREARYGAFEVHLQPGDVLLQGHHGNDQLETLLFRLERGTGLRGMMGIPTQRSHKHFTLYRPLLAFSRAALQNYAVQQGLDWIEDESNEDKKFRRNALRHEVVKPWQNQTPDISERVSRNVHQWQQDWRIYERLVNQALEGFICADGSLNACQLPEQEARFWLQCYLHRCGINLTSAQLDECELMLQAASDAKPKLLIGGWDIRRYKGRIFVMPNVGALTDSLLMAMNQAIHREHDWIHVDRKVTLGLRPEGVTLEMKNGTHKSLKKWLQEQHVPPWWRDQLPYLYEGNELVAIGTLWRSPNWPGVVTWQDKRRLPWPAECRLIPESYII